MNPIIVAAIIGAAGTIIVGVINVWGEKSRQLSEGTRPEGPSGVGEGSQGAPTGSESKREARSNSSRNGYVIWTGHLRTLFLLILIGSGMFWVYQRFWTDGRAARISITMVPLASDWRGQSIRSIEGTVSGTVPVGVH